MKWFKRVILSILIIGIIFFAFYKPKNLNLEGNWKPKTIVLEGKKIYPDAISEFFNINSEIIINNWTKSISVPTKSKNIEAYFEYFKTNQGKYRIKLFSKEKALNGNFDVIIDTFDIEKQSYKVDVKFTTKNSLIHFQKQVNIPPWKPKLPIKGRP